MNLVGCHQWDIQTGAIENVMAPPYNSIEYESDGLLYNFALR